MIFGADFFKWLQFALKVLQILADIFGDENSKSQAREVCEKHSRDFA